MAQCAVLDPTSSKVRSSRKIWLGRDREVGELDAGLDELVGGHGGVYLVTGEPGIGKTRLCDELGRLAVARGIDVHWGRAWEAGGAPPYWPFIQVLRGMCRGLDAEALARRVGVHGTALVELMPELRQHLPLPAGVSAAVVRERFELFDAVSGFVQAVAATVPQLVVLDDLHAADPSSLQLLHFLVRDLRSAPLMVVGTYREAEVRLAPSMRETLALVAREACMLPLRRLDRSEVADFVAQATGVSASAERVLALHDQTEGNPLFLRELLQLRGPLGHQPDGIREVVRARVSLLTPVVRSVLEAAAVVGREFGAEQLAAVAGAPEPEVRSWMAPAAEAGIVEPLPQTSRWRFTHVLLREALYESLSAERRAALHRAAAAQLRGRGGMPALAEIAHHLLHAIPAVTVGEAAQAALEAADEAMELLAFEDASLLLARAQKALEGVGGEERKLFEVLLALGVARIRAADLEPGKSTCRRAVELARHLGDGELFARAVLGSAYEFAPGVRNIELIARLEEALTALPAGDGALRARCMGQLAAERQPEPDTLPPMDLAREAVAMARRLGDKGALRFTLTTAGLAMLVYAGASERMAIDQETLRLALTAGDKRVALRAHLLLLNDFWEHGDLRGADPHARSYEALLQEFPHDSFDWVGAGVRAATAMWEGRFDEAERLYREAAKLALSDAARGASMAALPVNLCCAMERYEDLAGVESQVRAGFGGMTHELGGCIGEMLIAQAHGRAGDRVRAAAQLATVRAHPVFADIKEAAWLALLADACHLVGDVALAERLYPALLPRAQSFYNLGPLGPCCEPPYSRQLGLLAETLGRFDDAVSHLTDAEARTTLAGMRSHLARLRYELAGALLGRGRAGDHERAVGLLEDARALAEQLGQAGLLPLVSARVRGAGATDHDATPRAKPPSERSFTLRREGDYWSVVFGAGALRLRDSRGIQVLALLVASPGQEFHVLQLVAPGDDDKGDRGDAGVVLDGEAIQSYRRRLLDLREELEEAEGFSDVGRADRARGEIDSLTQELARGVGLGGRERRAGAAAERARTAVQKRLRNVVTRIADGLPELGTHLEHTIRTGTFCGYLPDGRVRGRH